jgi:TolA-binding protein
MTATPASRARVLALAGRILLDEKAATAAALEMFEQAARFAAPAAAEAARNARIGMGDVWRLRGDLEKAMAAYKAAGDLPGRAGAAAIQRGDYARYVEDFMRRGELEEALKHLAKWEYAFPADRLQGYSTLLRVRLLLAENEHAAAARQAEMLVKANPDSNYSPELLMHAAEAHAALGQTEQARNALKRLADNYAESPLAAEAAGKLESK